MAGELREIEEEVREEEVNLSDNCIDQMDSEACKRSEGSIRVGGIMGRREVFTHTEEFSNYDGVGFVGFMDFMKCLSESVDSQRINSSNRDFVILKLLAAGEEISEMEVIEGSGLCSDGDFERSSLWDDGKDGGEGRGSSLRRIFEGFCFEEYFSFPIDTSHREGLRGYIQTDEDFVHRFTPFIREEGGFDCSVGRLPCGMSGHSFEEEPQRAVSLFRLSRGSHTLESGQARKEVEHIPPLSLNIRDKDNKAPFKESRERVNSSPSSLSIDRYKNIDIAYKEVRDDSESKN